MKKHLAILCLIWFAIPAASVARQQRTYDADTARVHRLIDDAKKFINTDAAKALSLSMEAQQLAQQTEYAKGEANALKNIGLVHYFQGRYVQTLEYWNQSLALMQQINDEAGEANLLGNIGAVYANQGDDVNALNYHLKSLKIAERTGDKMRTFFALNNIAGIYFEKKATWDKALEYLLKAFPLAEQTGNTEALGLILGNIGEIYFEKGEDARAISYYNKSLQMGSEENKPFALNGLGKVYLKQRNSSQSLRYHHQALAIAQKLNDIHIVPSLQGIAANYAAQKNYAAALDYFRQAERYAVDQKSYPGLKELYSKMAVSYADAGDYAQAFEYQKKLDGVKDTLFNEATQKKLGLLQFEFDLEKKQGEINLLTKDKILREQQLKQQRFAKNAFAVGLVLIFIIAFIIFRSYRNKVKTNKLLDRQKDEIEDLLLNILPSEVAQELKTTGKATPRSYDSVSVLFTDFKGFTTIADKLSPEELVEELNKCFMAFDNIIEKHRLEKIKTIGDSYMCAGGIPTPDGDHTFRMVKASLEMQEYVFSNNAKRRAEGLPTWDVRIGIHVGPLVAGVVGKKKYAYDIWGSTVNIASRMESSGIPGQVNISAKTYEIIKEKYACIYRGKINAKNVGEIDMYLIDREIESFNSDAAEESRRKSLSTIIPG